MSRIRLVPVVIFFFATAVVLFGGWIVYRDYGLVRPLKNELAATKNVEMVAVNLSGPQKQVEVTLKQVSDLQTAYQTINNAVSKKLHQEVPIELQDKRTPEIEEKFRSYQPILYSGIAQGNYTEMIEKIQSKAKADGFTKAQVTMDRENIYIQLEIGENYLYEVIPYSEPSQTAQQGVKSL